MDRFVFLFFWAIRLIAAFVLYDFAAAVWSMDFLVATRQAVLVGFAAFSVCVLWLLEGIIRRVRPLLLRPDVRAEFRSLAEDFSGVLNSLPRDRSSAFEQVRQCLNPRYVLIGSAVLLAVLIGWFVMHSANERRVAKNMTVLAATSWCASWIGKEFNDRQRSEI